MGTREVTDRLTADVETGGHSRAEWTTCRPPVPSGARGQSIGTWRSPWSAMDRLGVGCGGVLCREAFVETVSAT